MTLPLFTGGAGPPAAMVELAKAYAAKVNWRFVQLTERPDLFGTSWRALFLDRDGVEHERTVDDLR